MAGIKLVLPSKFVDTTLPVLRDDAILNAGSLVLFDAMHPAKQWQAGAPVNGMALPNLATTSATALLGSATTIDGTLELRSSFSGAAGKAERSSKGGLHGIVSQAAGVDNALMSVRPPDSFMTYLQANTPANKFYVSVWGRVTRNVTSGTTNGRPYVSLARYSSGVYGHAWLTQTGADQRQPKTDKLLGARTEGHNTIGPMIQTIAGVANENMTVANYSATGAKSLGWWGRATPWTAGATDLPSWIFYRAYVEDLTVSGRTFAEADAVDYAAYTRAVINPGGRYYGDTFTSPTTIP